MSKFSVSLVPAPRFTSEAIAEAWAEPSSAATLVAVPESALTATPATTRAPKTCAFGANCACVFSRNQPAAMDLTGPDAAPLDAAVAAEVTKWTDLGWRVTASSRDEVVLERPYGLAFCANVLLSLATGLLFLAYWIPRSRHPRVALKRVTPAADGAVSVATTIERR